MMKTRLYRSDSYPYQNISEDVERERSIESASGQTYTITILDDEGINFKLTLPGGKKVTDNFNDYQDRSSLYQLLEDGVYEFIQETAKSIETEYIKTKGTPYVITMNNDKFVFTLDKTTGMMKIEYPARVSEFYLANIYIENPELPLLFDGRLNQYLQTKMKRLGIKMPRTPYAPGLRLVPNVQSAS
ncbi:MAG: hypothetical protein OQJ96_05865 [Flavobacteriales bacterium]|nr:hypothetical protein [Flavobacteriales bacterium]MCW9019809.1 hypothetical protein [Flavobacteriales bacterium]